MMSGVFNHLLDEKIIKIEKVSGGDINEAYKLTTSDHHYFAKTNDIDHAFEMFESEAKALNFLSKIPGIKVPAIKKIKKHNKTAILIMEWIETGNKRTSFNFDLAKMLSNLHKIENDAFGFEFDNFIGSLNQKNTLQNNWLDFYYQFRISAQLKLAIDNQKIETDYHKKVDNMFKNISLEFPHIVPSLLHGDLWSGNYMTDNAGKPVLIDPAIYFGHREMDIAMMKLFGGFNDEIFRLYDELLPLEYRWQDRIQFYQLYYILVHVNLFGGSYISSAKSIIDRYGK